MYLDNKYTNWYNSIINNARQRTLLGYTEKHHIIPSSIGGTNEHTNLVILTPREHFICHLLLTKMTTGNDYYKMSYALHMLSNVNNIGEGRYVPNSRLYEYSKKLFKEALSNFWTDEKRKEHAEKIRPTVKGRKHRPEAIQKMKNKRWSEKALKNRLNNCLKAAEARKGSKWSAEHREKKFMLYIEKNIHLFDKVFELFDQGKNIRQISIVLGISWDRVKYIVDNRDKILDVRGGKRK